jgi:hypothetical protein
MRPPRRRAVTRKPRKEHAPRIIAFSAATVLLLLVFFFARVLDPSVKLRPDAETVAAFRAPHQAIGLLKAQSENHGVPFAEVFTFFCAENDFFPAKAAAYDFTVLERQYVEGYEALKKKYDAKSAAPFIAMYETLFDEIQCFPVPDGFDGGADGQPSFMYGDSWGDERHRGADIYDRENIPGRVPVVSMTDGTVRDSGYTGDDGHYVGIITEGGDYYLYARLDGFAENISEGLTVAAGQPLGHMGDSGSGGEAFQARLHLRIKPGEGVGGGDFWINPYPLLRYIE